MASQIDICNMALGFLRYKPIADMQEKRPAAESCRLYFRPALEALLAEHPWNFAQARERLARVELSEGWARTYRFAYAMPARCVSLHWLVDEEGRRVRAFEPAGMDGRTVILANVERAFAEYTRLVEDTTCFEPFFIQALARKLQTFLAAPLLGNNTSAAQEAEQAYRQALAAARLRDAREGRPFQDGTAIWNGGHDIWTDVVSRECG